MPPKTPEETAHAYSPAEIALIRDKCLPAEHRATDSDLQLLLYFARRTGLDPLLRQIYTRSAFDKRTNERKLTVQCTIDGFRLAAQRTGQYEGQTRPEFCGADGKWTDTWLSQKPPVLARVGIWRKGFREPAWGVCRWDAYVQMTNNGQITHMWARMGDHLLAKVAEALAFRKAFPDILAGVYTDDEMVGDAADTTLDLAPPPDPQDLRRTSGSPASEATPPPPAPAAAATAAPTSAAPAPPSAASPPTDTPAGASPAVTAPPPLAPAASDPDAPATREALAELWHLAKGLGADKVKVITFASACVDHPLNDLKQLTAREAERITQALPAFYPAFATGDLAGPGLNRFIGRKLGRKDTALTQLTPAEIAQCGDALKAAG
jgi:phage recombination protein Bet